MRISQRLFLGVVPSLVGLFAVAGLAYWGQYSRAAPVLVVIAAAVASVVSLVVAWRNTRYVVRRVERLAAIRGSNSEADELDVIEDRVEHLGEEALAARADAVRVSEDASRKSREYARLISEAASAVSAKLVDSRLSLHVLQESHFGELNDNQDEMINAARDGVEAAEVELANLRTITDIDRGSIAAESDVVQIADIVRSLLPLTKARAEKKTVRLIAEIEPGLPRVMGDRSRLRDALALVLNDAVTYAIAGTSISVHVAADKDGLTMIVNHGSPHSSTSDMALAQRLVGVYGGSVGNEGEASVIKLRRSSSVSGA